MTATGTPPAGTSSPPVISVRGASFGYADRTVLSGVDLDVHPAEIVAVLGPNGSGKSTLVKGLLGLCERTGTVELFGVAANDFHAHERVGYVPQRHTLSGSVTATVEEVVSSGRLSRRGLWRPARQADRAAVARALGVVGMGDRARTDVATLSGGQQRRVLIARALAGEPDILVMDEPTAGVDARAQHGLADVLARLAGQGVTMLVVTHEMGPITELVTRVVVVDRGRVRFDGPRQAFVDASGTVLHEYQSHHHDSELAEVTRPLGPTGPLDREGAS
ncbi:MAG: metal ABC transporter ATP-binding protein [Dermatophilaceae bacterium]